MRVLSQALRRPRRLAVDGCPGVPAAPRRHVDVRAVGLNPVDFSFRQGKLRALQQPRLPLVLGNEFAGEVVAVGDKVQKFAVGDGIFVRVEKDRLGAFAEQAAVGEDYAAHMPPKLDFTTAAAVPLAALTAIQALRNELDLKPRQKVFISGGAGGVGTFAIQIAKTARRPRPLGIWFMPS